jgi:hypothetical protein
MNTQLIERLTALAANAKSPHIRRVAPFVAILADGLEQMGASYTMRYSRQALIISGDRQFVGRYQHPNRLPRQRGAIVFKELHRGRPGRVVRAISTLDEAIAFKQNPTL